MGNKQLLILASSITKTLLNFSVLFFFFSFCKNNFLDCYVAYLRDLPECISLIHVVILKEVRLPACFTDT